MEKVARTKDDVERLYAMGAIDEEEYDMSMAELEPETRPLTVNRVNTDAIGWIGRQPAMQAVERQIKYRELLLNDRWFRETVDHLIRRLTEITNEIGELFDKRELADAELQLLRENLARIEAIPRPVSEKKSKTKTSPAEDKRTKLGRIPAAALAALRATGLSDDQIADTL